MPVALICAIALLGCGSAAGRDGIEFPGADPLPASGLVWIRRGETGLGQTFWVRVEDGSSLSGQPIEGPVWADGRTLWQYVEEVEPVLLYEDEPLGAAPDPSDATSTTEVRRGLLRELVLGARVVVIDAPDPGPARALRHELLLEGSVGPYLFFEERLFIDSYGAHGIQSARATVWDLRSAATTTIATDRETAAWTARASERARRELGDRLEPEAISELAVVALHPRWEIPGGLGVDLQVAMPSCYTCSDGGWSDYTLGLILALPTLPERLDGELPRWVRTAAERAGGTLLGFTRVEHPEPAQILDSLSR